MKKVGLILIGICLFYFGLNSVKAETITYKRLDNINFNLTVDGQKESNHVTMFYLDDRLAYCIEPGKDITTKIYDSYPDWSKTGLTDEKQLQIEEIGYYGYEYPGHQSPKYYIATQELIWKAVRDIDIYWTDDSGNTLDISKEKDEIERLIKHHHLKPSFSNEIIKGNLGEEKRIVDTNNVLQDYRLENNSSHKIEIEGNNLKITFNEELKALEEIELIRNNYDNKTLLVYIKDNSQQLAALRLSHKEVLKLKIQNEEIPEEIVKVPSTADSRAFERFKIMRHLQVYEKKFN